MEKIHKKDWRFCSQRQRMSPFPNYMSMEAMCSRAKRYVGVNVPRILLLTQDRITTIFIPVKEFHATAEAVIKRIHKDPAINRRLIQTQHRFGKRLVNFAKQCFRSDVSKLSNARLIKLYETYENYYKDVYSCYGHVWIIEDTFNAELLGIVQKRIKDPAKAIDTLNILTLQPDAMVARIERENLYALAAKISHRKLWQNEVLQKDFREHSPALVKLIKQHEHAFFWVTRDYDDPVLTYETITEKLKEALKNRPQKVYQQMVAEREGIHKKQRALRKKLKLSPSEIALFDSMLDLAFLKELRKRYVSESLYYFDKVLLEIGARTYLSLKQVRFLTTKDVRDALLKHKNLVDGVNERIKQAGWLSTSKGTKILVGKQAKIYHDALIGYSSKTSEFSGLAVSPGIARGPAKIVMNPTEIGKVKKGDIIVSIQVVPSFAPAVLKAAGLICDGGHGITTHPAIIAREAGIPCVIQTQFARHVLKDGDLVEVDGYKGIARKLKG